MVTVVCTGGELPPPNLSLAWIDAAHTTIVADGGLRLFRQLNRRADLWIGDGDSLGPLECWAPWYREAKLLETAKDDSDTEASVAEALGRGATEVWILGGGGQRMDHWLANLRLVTRRPQITRWLTAREEIWSLGTGASQVFPAGTLSVFPLGTGPWKVRSRGLQWPLDTVDFNHWHSLSNVAGPGAEVAVESGRVLVLRPFPEEQPR